MCDELVQLRGLLREEEMKWMRSPNSKTLERIIKLDCDLSAISSLIYNSNDWVTATVLYNKISFVDDVEKCFYRAETKGAKNKARKLFREIGLKMAEKLKEMF